MDGGNHLKVGHVVVQLGRVWEFVCQAAWRLKLNCFYLAWWMRVAYDLYFLDKKTPLACHEVEID